MIPISQMKTMTVRREQRNPDTIKQKAKGCNRAKKTRSPASEPRFLPYLAVTSTLICPLTQAPPC